MKKIILIGAGGHAVSCLDVINQSKKFKVIGFVDNKKKVGSIYMGIKIIGTDIDLKKIRKLTKYAFVTVGYIQINNNRKKLYHRLINLGFEVPKIISPYAYLSKTAKVGNGSIIHHGVIINSLAEIGENCIINSKSLIEHGVKIGNHTHVSTSCIVNGDTMIGEECFLGSNSVIRNNIKISNKTFIKMGEKF